MHDADMTLPLMAELMITCVLMLTCVLMITRVFAARPAATASIYSSSRYPPLPPSCLLYTSDAADDM
eukprot:916176-Rhodomonas_salina.1